MIRKFQTIQQFEDFTHNQHNLISGDVYYVEENGSLHFYTNNIDGEFDIYTTEGGGDTTKVVHLIERTIEEFDVPEGTTKIGPTAFYSCKNLSSVNIPNSVTSLEMGCFVNCENLSSVNIPNSITSIGDYVFQSCKSLTSIDIPNSITSIGRDAFRNCSNLTSIEIPSSITTWPPQMLYGCSSLTSLTIPESVTSIGNDCFNRCSILSEVICERATPPTLGANAFFAATRLTVIYVPDESVEAYKTATNWKKYKSKIKPISEKP